MSQTKVLMFFFWDNELIAGLKKWFSLLHTFSPNSNDIWDWEMITRTGSATLFT